MKNKFLLIIFFSLTGTLAANAQANGNKAIKDMTARREKREKQMAELRTLVNEQKAQQATEKKAESRAALPTGTTNVNTPTEANSHTGRSIPAGRPAGQTIKTD